MEGRGKGKGGDRNEEFMGKKLKQRLLVGNRGGAPCTPSPTWRLELSSSPDATTNTNTNTNTTTPEFLTASTTSVSARKLCANLWEIQPPLHKMNKGPAAARTRHPHNKNNNPPGPASQATSINELRHVSTSVTQHHQYAERNDYTLQPLSPESYASSTEVAPFNLAVTPASSSDFRGRMGDSSYNLKTSTELLKVLNRIWSLEEQHTSNRSLVKALKMELNHSRAQIRKLLKEKQDDRKEMDELVRQVAEEKLTRKSKQQDRMKAAVQSVRDELEDERKLRKRSESLHRKLVRELSDIKPSFSNALKELERERKARVLLENLCDEFAKGIRDYEVEVRSLRQKSETDQIDGDRLLLHISEAWLDERMQMKVAEAKSDFPGKNTTVDKLSSDIETFLLANQSVGKMDGNESCSRQQSSESFPLYEAVSAPQDAADEEESDTDSHCFELNGSGDGKQKKKVGDEESSKEKGNDGQERKSREARGSGINSNHVLLSLIRNHSLSMEGEKVHPVENSCVPSRYTGHASPVQKWVSKLNSPDFEKCGLKETTLKAKLLEARLEGKNCRFR